MREGWPAAAAIARARSAKLRPVPVPRLKSPFTCRTLQQPEHHVDTVLHVDEVAQLPAVRVVGVVRRKERHGLPTRHQWILLRDHALHRALVIFVRAVDVEELEPDPLGWCRLRGRDTARDPAVEKMLAPAIGVQRT